MIRNCLSLSVFPVDFAQVISQSLSLNAHNAMVCRGVRKVSGLGVLALAAVASIERQAKADTPLKHTHKTLAWAVVCV